MIAKLIAALAVAVALPAVAQGVLPRAEPRPPVAATSSQPAKSAGAPTTARERARLAKAKNKDARKRSAKQKVTTPKKATAT